MTSPARSVERRVRRSRSIGCVRPTLLRTSTGYSGTKMFPNGPADQGSLVSQWVWTLSSQCNQFVDHDVVRSGRWRVILG